MSSHKNSNDSEEKREAQITVNEAIEKLIIYVSSVILFNENDENWNKIYNDIEGVIKEATTHSRARRSGGSEKTNDEEV